MHTQPQETGRVPRSTKVHLCELNRLLETLQKDDSSIRFTVAVSLQDVA